MSEMATAVSIRADKQYLRALRNLADEKGIRVADLVRSALDEAFSDELKPYLSFFANCGNKNYQTDDSIESGVV